MKGLIRGNEEDVSDALLELSSSNIMTYENEYVTFENFSESSVDMPYWTLSRIFEDCGEDVGMLLKFFINTIGMLHNIKRIWDLKDFERYGGAFYLARCIGLGIVEYIPRGGKSWFRISERED